MVRRSKVHFVHCLLPKAEAVGGSEPRVPHGESSDSGLMTLDVGLLRAQLRGSKLLEALRIYRQGKQGVHFICFHRAQNKDHRERKERVWILSFKAYHVLLGMHVATVERKLPFKKKEPAAKADGKPS